MELNRKRSRTMIVDHEILLRSTKIKMFAERTTDEKVAVIEICKIKLACLKKTFAKFYNPTIILSICPVVGIRSGCWHSVFTSRVLHFNNFHIYIGIRGRRPAFVLGQTRARAWTKINSSLMSPFYSKYRPCVSHAESFWIYRHFHLVAIMLTSIFFLFY